MKRDRYDAGEILANIKNDNARPYEPPELPKERKVRAKRQGMVGSQVKQLREAFHMTQAEFAEAVEISVRTIQDWEQYNRDIDGMSEDYLRHMIRCKNIGRYSMQCPKCSRVYSLRETICLHKGHAEKHELEKVETLVANEKWDQRKANEAAGREKLRAYWREKKRLAKEKIDEDEESG